ncbi:MAG: aldose 1-epimerase [Bacteroidota bacterium]
MSFETIVTGDTGHQVITLMDMGTGCQAEIYGFGGLLNAFHVPHKGGLVNVIDGFSSVKDAMDNITNGFKSTKLSPFVCRMKRGEYRFENKGYTIQKYFLSGHAIHGLLYDAVFTITGTISAPDHAGVTMEYDYKGTDEGYPFPYKMIIHWKLEATNKLSVTTTLTHQNQTNIPVADGWHPYFTLGGSVDDCLLQFDSNCQLEYDADLLPTGKKFSDTRFTNGSSLRGIELDNSFELDTNMAAKCVLENDAFRLTIEAGKAYPLLQLYIPSHRNSIAIENLSGAPDNFNNGMGLILLAPGEEKVFTTSYTVIAKK